MKNNVGYHKLSGRAYCVPKREYPFLFLLALLWEVLRHIVSQALDLEMIHEAWNISGSECIGAMTILGYENAIDIHNYQCIKITNANEMTQVLRACSLALVNVSLHEI